MKKSIISLVIVILLLVGVLGYFLLNQQKEEVILKDNQLILNKFQYTYDHKVSMICPGTTEIFSFIYNQNSIVITAQRKNLVGGKNLDINDYPECINRGNLINFYNSSKGLSSGLPNGCSITEQLPSSYDNPEFLIADCISQVKFKILDLEKFNSCISKETCNLINGIDVSIL